MEDNAENEEKDLATEKKRTGEDLEGKKVEEKKTYENVLLDTTTGKIPVMVVENDVDEKDEEGKQTKGKQYDIFCEIQQKQAKIATILSDGSIILNTNILTSDEYSDDAKRGIQDLWNRLGESDKVDLNKFIEELEAAEKIMNREEDKEEKNKEFEEEIGDKDNEKETEDKEKEDKDKEDKEKEDNDKEKQEKEPDAQQIAKRRGVPAKDILIIKKDSQFIKNYPQLKEEEGLYLIRNKDGSFRGEYTDKNGNIKPSKYLNKSTTMLKESTIVMGDKNIARKMPYQVMTTNGLSNNNIDSKETRLEIFIENGVCDAYEARQGKNGEWVSHRVETKGKSYNSKDLNELSSTKTNKTTTSEISDRVGEIEKTALADDGIDKEELKNPRILIEELVEAGYQRKEAEKIYYYVTRPTNQLSVEEAKEKVNEEIEEAMENVNEDNEMQKVPGPKHQY